MALFDVGSYVIITSTSTKISGSTSLDVSSTLTTMFNNQAIYYEDKGRIQLGMETMIISYV